MTTQSYFYLTPSIVLKRKYYLCEYLNNLKFETMKNITSADFAELEKNGLPIVVDFYATWCGPCKKIGPIIEELAAEYEGKVNIVKCNVDDDDELASKFGIRNVPTVIFIKNGEVVDKHVGAAPKNEFVTKIEGLL